MSWTDLLLNPTSPVLPATWVLQWGRSIAWAVVLACLGAILFRRQPQTVRVAVAMALALWALVPGEVSPSFWLALAFQSPSLVGCLLCGYALAGLWTRAGLRARWLGSPSQAAFTGGCAWAGVALGYLLLLDTLALLPFQMYAWGFGPLALACALALSCLPWVVGMRGPLSWTAPVALLLFALTRLPSGNLWDALLDPITWVALHVVLIARARARSATRA
jgi:hypothetical protein